jgi:hypothetical protein
VPIPKANIGMSLGVENLAGYDPGVFKRYAELIFASQGIDPSKANQYLPWSHVNPSVFRMLRCGLVCYDKDLPPQPLQNPLPLAVLISDWVKLDSRDLILSYVSQPTFDPATTVVLQSDPPIKTIAAAGTPGIVKASQRDTDTIEVDATLQRPAILLVTTNYSTGWRIRPIESAQSAYQIIPADWTLIGIPLAPGRHRLVLEYSPFAFRIGRWVSIFALLGLLATSILLMRRSPWFR